ncbi:MAG: glycosyltransferase, partial [Flavisolibacter sp.]
LLSIKDLFNLYRLVRREKIKVIHAFCTPAGSIGYFLSKLTGAELVIDSYEPHAESMVENATWEKSGIAYKVLHHLEKKQTERAGSLIATTQGMKKYAKEKFDVEVVNFFVKPACVDLTLFKNGLRDSNLVSQLMLENKIVCVYAGKLGGIYLKEEVFDFIQCCYEFWGDRFRFLMLTNATDTEINEEIKRVNIPEEIVIKKFVLHDEVPKYLALGDFAINPVKSVPTKRYCTSIKDGEYWAMGLPVVITSNISDDSDIIEESKTGYVLKKLDKEEYNQAINVIDEMLKQDRTVLKNRIRALAEQYRSFSIAEKIYKTIYN